MKNEKFLMFGQAFGTQTISSTDATVQSTTALVDPVASLNANSITNGILQVLITAHADHDFNAAFGTPSAGDVVDISSGCTVGASDGELTIKTKSNGGFDVSSTVGNNVVKLNLLKHIDGGELCAWPASSFKGAHIGSANTETLLFFKAQTNDKLGNDGGISVDTVTITHGANKFNEVLSMIRDGASSSKGGAIAEIANVGDAVYIDGNPAVITGVSIALDA